MNTCYIFGSVDVKSFNVKPDKTDFIIAADRGYLNVKKFNIIPHIIVGDFDSLNYVPNEENVIQHPVKKDDTDLILAVKTGFEKGYNNFIIYGCLGGERIDHTVASIQTASYILENNGTAVFVDGNTHLTLLQNNTIRFDANCDGDISVFSYSEKATVSISGLLYNLNKTEINNNHPLGVSNEFKRKTAQITIYYGKALIIWNTNKGKYTIGEWYKWIKMF